jgi:hypothetical protein
MTDHLLRGIQSAINIDQPGFTVAHHAVIVGLQRLDDASGIQSGVGTPDGQPDDSAEGLLIQGDRLGTAAWLCSSTVLLGMVVAAGLFGLYRTIRVVPGR